MRFDKVSSFQSLSLFSRLRNKNPSSVKDNTLAPKYNPKYDPQSAKNVEISANLISLLMMVLALCAIFILSIVLLT